MARAAGLVPDLEALEGDLRALSFVNRLELLAKLQEPRTVDELKLTPRVQQRGASPDRTLTRQAVRHHLDKLVEAGLVHASTVHGDDGRPRRAYVVNDARVYQVAESLRELSSLGGQAPVESYSTQDLRDLPRNTWPEGPKLVLVHGAPQAEVFPLRQGRLRAPRGWIIGRSPEAHVRLAYDPYVSSENSEIVPENGSFRLLDLRSSKNGTVLNGERMEVGGEERLEHGDIVRVGSSVLVFRANGE